MDSGTTNHSLKVRANQRALGISLRLGICSIPFRLICLERKKFLMMKRNFLLYMSLVEITVGPWFKLSLFC